MQRTRHGRQAKQPSNSEHRYLLKQLKILSPLRQFEELEHRAPIAPRADRRQPGIEPCIRQFGVAYTIRTLQVDLAAAYDKGVRRGTIGV